MSAVSDAPGRDSITEFSDGGRLTRFSSRRERLSHVYLKDRLKGASEYLRIAGYFRWSIFDLVNEEIESIGKVRVVCNSDLDPQDINAAKLERLGLADQVGPAQGTLKTGLEPTLRDLAIRGDIIKTMRRAMSGAGNEPDVARFALHGDQPAEAVLGRLVERGLHDELKGMAYPSSTASTGARTTLFSLAWK
jgi:hypothetical protein